MTEGGRHAPFGRCFTPHMLLADYDPVLGWGQGEILPRQALAMDPACMVLHYGQAVFEGVKAYRQPGGGMALFRATDHARRLTQSCERLAIPPPSLGYTLEQCRRFVAHECEGGSRAEDHALYLRPLIFGLDPVFGVKPSSRYQLVMLGLETTALPYLDRLNVYVCDEYVRAAPGGLGSAHHPGNYAAGMAAHSLAQQHGCEQVLWLDAGRRRWVEELSSMSIIFVLDGSLVTPPASSTTIASITRSTLLTLAQEDGLPTEERPVALEEITAAMAWQGITEAIGASTGMGVVSLGSFQYGGQRLALPASTPVADRLRALVSNYQRGLAPDTHGWRDRPSASPAG